MIYYMSDFETTVAPPETTADEAHNHTTRVWLAASVNVDDDKQRVIKRYSIEEWLDWVFSLPNHNQIFHNLGKFDGYFIFDALLTMGFKHLRPGGSAVGNYIVGTTGSFTVYVDMAPDTVADKRGWTPRVYNFIDSKDLLDTSVRSLGKSLGRDDLLKGDTPLLLPGQRLEDTPVVDQNGDPTGRMWTWAEALEYVDNDVLIVSAALRRMNALDYLDSGINTQAALAYNSMLIGKDPIDHPRVHRRAAFRARHTPKFADSVAPNVVQHTVFNPWGSKGRPDAIINGQVQSSTEYLERIAHCNEDIKYAYKGGFNWVNPIHQNQWVGEGMVLDVNSMYPYIYSTHPLPRFVAGITESEHINDPNSVDTLRAIVEREGLFPVVEFEVLDATCSDQAAPIIKPHTRDDNYNDPLEDGGYRVNETYARHIRYDKGIVLTSAELAYMLRWYTINEIHITKVTWYQRDEDLEARMRHHCEHWMRAKEQAGKNSFERLFAKLMVNTPYGKLGQYTRVYKEPEYQLIDGRLKTVQVHDSRGGRSNADIVTASYITAYGRVLLGETMNKIGMDRVLYGDTDSVHMLGIEEPSWFEDQGITIDQNKIGAWDIEATFSSAKFIKPKTYGEEINDGDATRWHTTCAGFTKQIPKHLFEVGASFPERINKVAPGGILLLDSMKSIQEPEYERVGYKVEPLYSPKYMQD